MSLKLASQNLSEMTNKNYSYYFGFLILAILWNIPCPLVGQDQSKITGSLDVNGNFFLRDSAIGADNTPQYDKQLYGAEAWLNLNYTNWGFDVGVRFDLYNNSNLINPNQSYTDLGVGRWYIKKSINKFHLAAGYLYDQIGAGIIYRAYEERPLAIDNALFGLRLSYDVLPDWKVKIFSGKQKNLFSTYGDIVKGGSFEGFLAGGEKQPWSIAPGVGIVNRTYNDQSIDKLVGQIAAYQVEDQVKPKYNVYAMSVFNTLTLGDFTWYIEGAYKTDDVYYDPNELRQTNSGGLTPGKLVSKQGNVLYSTLSYAAHGLGITLEGKRTESFEFRAQDPFITLSNSLINFLPPMQRTNTYRLTARYNAATQFIGEQGYQVDVRYKINKKLSVLTNYANIMDLDGEELYREIFTEVIFKKGRKWQLLGGVQLQNYNQQVYEGKTQAPNIETITPYAELLYKFDRKRSLRIEGQYMHTEQDFGSWTFGLVEFGIAPHWIFELSDMYNISPQKKKSDGSTADKIHYPTLGVKYINKSNSFQLRYVKQVEGVVCSGGICRFEPAFSGVKLTISSIF